MISHLINLPIVRKDEAGASMVEYALLVVLIAIIAFAAVQLAGNTLSSTYGDISQSLTNANNGG